MKNRLIKAIIIFCILLLVLIVIYIANPISTSSSRIKEINSSRKLNEKTKIPINLHYIIGKYDGFLAVENIVRNYNHFAEYAIPKYFKNCKDLDSEKLKKYFETNKNTIDIELNYQEYSEFEAFINKIKTLNGEELVFENYRILDDSIGKITSATSAYIEIEYKDSGKVIFESEIPKFLNDEKSSIKLNTNMDEDIIEKDKESYNQRKEVIENTDSPYTRGSPVV